LPTGPAELEGFAMKSVIWTENSPWDEVLRLGEQKEVLLIRDGHAVALVVPIDDDDLS